jgi:hypothetical protein
MVAVALRMPQRHLMTARDVPGSGGTLFCWWCAKASGWVTMVGLAARSLRSALRASTLGNCSLRCSTKSIPGLVISLSAASPAPGRSLGLGRSRGPDIEEGRDESGVEKSRWLHSRRPGILRTGATRDGSSLMSRNRRLARFARPPSATAPCVALPSPSLDLSSA